jgi:predicted aldo/keto reductase-like oxidoreductase
MQYRRLGKTGLRVSAVGFGTSQLRRVTSTVAIDTLLQGFDLGVNIVHTAADYGGAEELIAQALARTSKKIIVASNAYDVHRNRTGRVRHFERLFEATCRKFKTDRLDLFGIASVDDREALGENVWGRHGMVEFIQRKKAQGRIGATFCSSHGSPEFSKKLIESGAFDAIMLSYTDLGFHLLSMTPTEDVIRTRNELFPLCLQHDVGLMIMLPLAGGMLCQTHAFGPGHDAPGGGVNAADALRSILCNEAVSCVMPGTASIAEARENALAGHALAPLPIRSLHVMNERIKHLQSSLCSRCGSCELTCSQKLPIRWMFRATYMSIYPNSPYETSDEWEYFRLHPRIDATCATCTNVTCLCPSGIDIPHSLVDLHGQMLKHLRRGLVAPPLPQRKRLGNRWFGARVVRRELPDRMQPGQTRTCRLFVENLGLRRWHPSGEWHRSVVRLEVFMDDARICTVNVREKIGRSLRCHFAFELTAPHQAPFIDLRLQLVRHHPYLRDRRGLLLFASRIPIGENE